MEPSYQVVCTRQLLTQLQIFLVFLFSTSGLTASTLIDDSRNPKTIKVGLSSTDQQIRNQLLEITPIGTPLEQALKFASLEGQKHGMSMKIVVSAASKPGLLNSSIPNATKLFALTGDYPVLYGFLYYHLFANYLFDSQDRLVDIRAWIGPGASTFANLVPSGLLLGFIFLIAVVVLLASKRPEPRTGIIRFYSWIICASFAIWVAADLIFRASGGTWGPIVARGPVIALLEILLVLTYLPLGTTLLLLWFLAGNILIGYSFYAGSSVSRHVANTVAVTLLVGISDVYLVWWLLFRAQGWN